MSGGGFGALDAMNKAIKNNRGLVRKISAFERLKEYSVKSKYDQSDKPDNKLSRKELDKLKQKTIREDRIHTFKSILKMILVLSAIVIFIKLIIEGTFNRFG